MGSHLPQSAASREITGDTQFMFQFYKPCFQFYAPNEKILSMSTDNLQRSLIAALQGCPLLFGRLTVQKDKSISLEYDPKNINSPIMETQSVETTYADLMESGFSYALARKLGLDMPIPDGSISQARDTPMLMIKVSYLNDGGVAVFSMSNHVAFDGNAVFSFLAHWAKCNREMAQQQESGIVAVAPPPELQISKASPESSITKALDNAPAEIAVDATKSPAEISAALTRKSGKVCTSVFSIPVICVAQLKQQVVESSVLGEGQWVSTNSVLAAFLAQHLGRANVAGGVFEAGDWTVFQSMDMRRPLGQPLHGLGSPVMLAEYHASYNEIVDDSQLPKLALCVRESIGKYSGEHLRQVMNWMNSSYRRLVTNGVEEPWRHFWFTALDSTRRAVGVSCMNRIPIYDADFGAGYPTMARSFNPRQNYVIVFPGPPATKESLEYEVLHLYISLEQPAMEALVADHRWNQICTLVSEC
ncbi:hypothetical protein COEREDRAFT_94440 [Coemansia reversa NRRL 1564]|uniref:Transferase n=1 Tax=Coemansia reversa (strain ATCC 12441 / NRRL 1564) TaxID=763665 RepID=A0A2G5B3Q4_COERN|nr:hypothetical protein COEREDRAFT_94440 [Coemansia reversa NRRL 1564]|eukprot:PIA13634.1 hypothetical protein COEREDRAFT_94440 [Coemansia reversa NRRL 1564]